MNIPTYCTNCDTSEGVNFVCRGCKFARFCSKDCLKKCWKKHKRYCMPLTDAVNDSIEKARPLLRDKYRIDDQDLHCMFCLEGGTSEDPLFQSGCACRPDSGMGVGHIHCFQDFARASFADDKKKIKLDCDVTKCKHCSQLKNGILKFEMFLTLSKLCDPDCLTRQSDQGLTIAKVGALMKALNLLSGALLDGESSSGDSFRCSRLRVIFRQKNLLNQIACPELRLKTEFKLSFEIGQILYASKKYQVAIDFNRRNYEKLILSISQYPHFKFLRPSIVRSYATSLVECFKESYRSNMHEPLYVHLDEAERLIREELLECNDIALSCCTTHFLCEILSLQKKFAEAKQILPPCIEKMKRVFGPSHSETKKLMVLYKNLCLCT